MRTPSKKRVAVAQRNDYEDMHPTLLTPDAVVTAIKAYVQGDVAALIDLYLWILRIDLSIRGIVQTRIDAVGKLDWEITPGVVESDDPDRQRAAEAADWCSSVLSDIESFEEMLNNVLDGNQFGVTLTEIMWGQRGVHHIPDRFVPVNQASIIGDPTYPWQINVTTFDDPIVGVPISKYPHKFVQGRSQRIGNSPWGGATAMAITSGGIFKRLGVAWFLAFCEKWGTPFIWATWDQNAKDDDKTNLEKMLASFAHDGYGGFPENFNINLLDVAKSATSLPQYELCKMINEEVARGLLGQTLTSGTQGDTGSFALGKVHNLVRHDIRDNDIKREGAAIRKYLLTPMIEFGPFRGSPVPYFGRVVEEDRDLDEMIKLGQQTEIRRGLLYEAAQVPVPPEVDGEELILLETAPEAPPLGDFGFAADRVPRLPQPARRASPHTVLRQWVGTAIDAGKRQVREIFEQVKAIDWPAKVNKTEAAEIIGAAIENTPTDQLRDLSEQMITASMLAGYYNAQRRYLVAAEPDLTIYTKPFADAIKTLRNRVSLPADVFERLAASIQARAGRVAGMFNVRLVQKIYERIAKVLEEGGTVADFQEIIRELESSKEWGTSNPNHVRQVFQQNATMAFQAGQYEQAATAGAVAYTWRARGKSCKTCKPYIDKTFSTDDLSVYPGYTHHGCDCWAEHRFAGDVPESKILRISEISNPELDALRARPSAIRATPAEFANLEKLDLDSVPSGLKRRFRKFVNDV